MSKSSKHKTTYKISKPKAKKQGKAQKQITVRELTPEEYKALQLEFVKKYRKVFEDEWQSREDHMSTIASAKSSIWYQAVTYLALCKAFHFGGSALEKLHNEMEAISERITATYMAMENGEDLGEDAYTIDDVRDELKTVYGVEFDMDQIEEIENEQ